MSFADLRNGPTVLVGYSYPGWRDISAQMRDLVDGARRPVGITNNGTPAVWFLPDLPRTATPPRITPPSRPLFIRNACDAGRSCDILQYGTDAAKDLFDEALRDAPGGWQTKNLQ